MDVKINCSSGFELSLDEMNLFSGKLKKHSLLEIERVIDSIESDGFLFPIAISKVGGKNYVVDGECRYYALMELKNRGFNINSVPVFYVKSTSDENLIKNTLIATSTNHCVTENSLKEFSKNTSIDLKNFGFSNMALIDFHEVEIDLRNYKDAVGGKEIQKGVLLNEDLFLGLLK